MVSNELNIAPELPHYRTVVPKLFLSPAPAPHNGICLHYCTAKAFPAEDLGLKVELGEEAGLGCGWRGNERRAGLGAEQGLAWSCSWAGSGAELELGSELGWGQSPAGWRSLPVSCWDWPGPHRFPFPQTFLCASLGGHAPRFGDQCYRMYGVCPSQFKKQHVSWEG